MKNRTPPRADPARPLPDFHPVERRYRHDGWTPERQRAFIAALADTGSVSRAAAMVNMTPEGAYYLRRLAGAESFRRAWEAARLRRPAPQGHHNTSLEIPTGQPIVHELDDQLNRVDRYYLSERWVRPINRAAAGG